ncbi:MAG: class I SAM-dependent methyltransferase [Lysobacterales bacterium]
MDYINRFSGLALALLFAAPAAFAQSTDAFAEKIRAAMAADIRTESETVRDANRKPVETLSFIGLNSDMKVLELVPSRGWYTKLLAPAIDDFHVAIGTTSVKDNLKTQAGFEHINVIEPKDMAMSRDQETRLNSIAPFSFGETGFDAVLTFRNVHNFDEAGRRNINAAAFEALSSGGVYAVVDHTRRHMEPLTPVNRRRADPVAIIKEAQDAGFMLHSYSDLHYKPADNLTLEVGNDAVTGQTDRFTLVFRKP